MHWGPLKKTEDCADLGDKSSISRVDIQEEAFDRLLAICLGTQK